MSEQFENVSIIKKANVYFGGQVTSRTVIFADGSKKTLGFMQAGDYEFGTEAAELMEHFQWLTPQQSRAVAEEPGKLTAVSEELADVVCYALAMANELGLDLSTALAEKMAKNERKYPASEYRGRFGPDDPSAE